MELVLEALLTSQTQAGELGDLSGSHSTKDQNVMGDHSRFNVKLPTSKMSGFEGQ